MSSDYYIDFHGAVEPLLLRAAKPARYTGGEFNTPHIKTDAPLSFLMCFPDVYEVAMSNLGIKILYDILNARPDAACERCFAPWPDFGTLLKESGVPLYSLETRRAPKAFGMIGFSLQYELSYSNVLYMLELMQLHVWAHERAESDPVIIAGGPCTVNPLPVAGFFDLIVIGDGEEVLSKLADLYVGNKAKGGGKAEFLAAASRLTGVFVPSIHIQNYKNITESGGFNRTPPVFKRVSRAIVESLDRAYHPERTLVPNIESIHDRAVVEIFRGCTRGCRFCQAGYIYRPVRYRGRETCKNIAFGSVDGTGFDELTLSSLSSGDYPEFKNLVEELKPELNERRVSLSLPSLRLDSYEDVDLGDRKSSVTFAPEAGSQRLRDIINKNFTEEEIEKGVLSAIRKGYSNIKLYFMTGLPFETKEDIDGIVGLCRKIKRLYRENCAPGKGGRLRLTASASVFIPKPFTPFQWCAVTLPEAAVEVQRYLKDELKRIGVNFNYHDAETSLIEAVFARGDLRLNNALYSAYRAGCKFDGWSELFDYSKWREAIESVAEVNEFAGEFSRDRLCPWEECVDTGVDREFLLAEYTRAERGEVTEDCRAGCLGCGINKRAKCFSID